MTEDIVASGADDPEADDTSTHLSSAEGSELTSRDEMLAALQNALGGNQQLTSIMATVFAASFSPLPPPAQLAEYDRLFPGSAQMFLDGFHAQTEHRMGLEKSVIKGNSRRSWVGMVFAGVIELGVIASAMIAISKNESWTVPIFACLMGIPFGAYALAQRRQRLERETKDRQSQIPFPGSQFRPFEPR